MIAIILLAAMTFSVPAVVAEIYGDFASTHTRRKNRNSSIVMKHIHNVMTHGKQITDFKSSNTAIRNMGHPIQFTKPGYFSAKYYTGGGCSINNIALHYHVLLNTCSLTSTGLYTMTLGYTSNITASNSLRGGENSMVTSLYTDSQCTKQSNQEIDGGNTTSLPSTCFSRAGDIFAGFTTVSYLGSFETSLAYSTINTAIIESMYSTSGCATPIASSYIRSGLCFSIFFQTFSCSGITLNIIITHVPPKESLFSYIFKSNVLGTAYVISSSADGKTCGSDGPSISQPLQICAKNQDVPSASNDDGLTGDYTSLSCQSAATTTSSSSKSCFAGSETVTMESGGVKSISKVIVGDRVLAADATGKTMFSSVVYVPYKANIERTLFAHISTESRDVKVTMNHILPAGACGSSLPLVYASQVTPGDCIMTITGQETVISVVSFESEGVFTIITNEEYVVVNGIIASSFGANHMMANLFYNVHRFAFALSPLLLTFSLLHTLNEGLGVMIPFFDQSA